MRAMPEMTVSVHTAWGVGDAGKYEVRNTLPSYLRNREEIEAPSALPIQVPGGE